MVETNAKASGGRWLEGLLGIHLPPFVFLDKDAHSLLYLILIYKSV